jgi:predicted transcriptional regulator
MSGVVVSSKLRLRNVRYELLLTQKQLVKLSHVSEPTIIRAEAGMPISGLSAQRILNAINEQRIARGLSELSLDDLDWNIDGD